jgi:hypothetical protein
VILTPVGLFKAHATKMNMDYSNMREGSKEHTASFGKPLMGQYLMECSFATTALMNMEDGQITRGAAIRITYG